MTTPDWLVRHGGELRLAPDRRTWLVVFDGGPQYKLTPTPAAGRYSCMVLQTVNGKRLDKGHTYATADDALRGGSDELRLLLGW